MRFWLLATLFFTATAFGAASQQELETCAGQHSAAAKLNCFIALTDRGRKTPAPVTQPEESAPSEITHDAPDKPPVEKPPAPPPSPAQSAVAKTPTTDLGEEQVARPGAASRQAASQTVMVTKVTEGIHGVLIFHMDNGHIWRQIERGYFPYPKRRAFTVEIDRGMMGEYRMRVEGKGRMVRIRRLK